MWSPWTILLLNRGVLLLEGFYILVLFGLCRPVEKVRWGTILHLMKLNMLSRECMFLGSLSRHNKGLEWQTLKPPRRVTTLGSWIDRVIALRSRKDRVIALRQISVKLSVTALFYLEDSRKIHLRGARARRSKDAKRRAPQRGREREKASFGSSFYSFPLPGPVLCKLGRPGVLFVLPEVLTLVLGPSFVLFSQAFPFFVF